MAWSAISSVTTGDLITASVFNQAVVSNPNLLKTSITNAGGLMYPNIVTTTATAGYSHVIDTDVIIVTAGDVPVLLATATASSTGRQVVVKNWGSGTVTYHGGGCAIDGTTSTSRTILAGNSLSFFRFRSTDWAII